MQSLTRLTIKRISIRHSLSVQCEYIVSLFFKKYLKASYTMAQTGKVTYIEEYEPETELVPHDPVIDSLSDIRALCLLHNPPLQDTP